LVETFCIAAQANVPRARQKTIVNRAILLFISFLLFLIG
jgi:hypothetical protein